MIRRMFVVLQNRGPRTSALLFSGGSISSGSGRLGSICRIQI